MYTYPSASQAGQDKFAYTVLSGKRNGTYLDIGCGVATEVFTGHNGGNNTVNLFRELDWKGYGFDIDINNVRSWNDSRCTKDPIGNKCFWEDVTKVDWNLFISQNELLQDTIDYISFDVDDATVEAVKNFPWDKIRFRAMTIEHDAYRVGSQTKEFIKETLFKHGYDLVCEDVNVDIGKLVAFEDWWVDLKTVDKDIVEKLRCKNKIGHEICTDVDIDVDVNIPSSALSIPVSIGEAIDKFTILKIKKEMITDSEKLIHINKEISVLQPLLGDYIEKIRNFYDALYKVNYNIWVLSDTVRTLRKDRNSEYTNTLQKILDENDIRYGIKNKINQITGSVIKEQKNYVGASVPPTTQLTKNYICGGKMGDLIHSMYALFLMYKKDGSKANLYISDTFSKNTLPFSFSLERAYEDSKNIIEQQEYINSYQILSDAPNVVAGSDFIELSSWRESPNLYRTGWCELISSHFSLPELPMKWISLNSTTPNENIVIHFRSRGHEDNTNFPWEKILSENVGKCKFITCDKTDWDNFPHKNLVPLQICTLTELAYEIENSKFFIGNQSSPLAIACSMHRPLLADLLNHPMDSLMYKTEPKNNPNFFWIWRDEKFVNGIEKFIRF